MAKTEVFIQNGGSVILNDTDFFASGGEGSIYLKGGFAYKLYLDPEKARANGMISKMEELKKVQHFSLVTPQDLLLNQNSQLIGYRMKEVKGISLMEMFSNNWWTSNNYSFKEAASLVQKMKESLQAVHKCNALAVDANEMNWMVANNDPKLIDCDSWQIGKFPATAIMPSIRDYQTSGFSEKTDWFSWAIVTFQLFTGIHPFKGSHPDFKKGDLENRMKKNASVFDPNVKTASSVRAFDEIPNILKDWYFETFQNGLREIPPTQFEGVAKRSFTKRKTVFSSGSVQKTLFWETKGKILSISTNGFVFFEENKNLGIFDLNRNKLVQINSEMEDFYRKKLGVFVRQGSDILFVCIKDGKISAKNVNGGKDGISMPSNSISIIEIENRVYALNEESNNGLQELQFFQNQNAWNVGTKSNWPMLVKSTKRFGSVFVMNYLGMPFIMNAEEKSHISLKADFLKDFQISNAISADSNMIVLMGIEKKSGKMKMITSRKDMNSMKLDQVLDVDFNIPVASLKSGVVVTIPEDNKLFLVSSKFPDGKWIENSGLSTDEQIVGTDQGLFGFDQQKIFKLKMS